MASLGNLTIKNPLANSSKNLTGSGQLEHTVGQAVGAALNALPGYSTLGANITNPSVNYQGVTNPSYTSATSIPAPKTLGASTTNGQRYTVDANGNYVPTYAGTYGSGGATQPDTTGLQNSIRSKISAIQNAYNSLQGNIQGYANDQTNQYMQNYDQQQKGLNDTYGQTASGIAGNFMGRGLQDSSLYGNAQQGAANTYNDNLTALNTNKQSSLAGIGQAVAQQLAGVKASQDQYNNYLPQIGSYNSNDLASLDATLSGVVPGIQSQAAGIGTNQGFINQLAQYAPQVNNGASQLQAQLQTLINSGVPKSAANTIGQGLINSTPGADPAYYQDYFSKLLAGQA